MKRESAMFRKLRSFRSWLSGRESSREISIFGRRSVRDLESRRVEEALDSIGELSAAIYAREDRRFLLHEAGTAGGRYLKRNKN